MTSVRNSLRKWRYSLPGLALQPGRYFGLREHLREARGARMLIYHGICMQDPFHLNYLFISRHNFESHLKLYKKYCTILNPADFLSGNYTPGQFNICLSFDDGFANNHKYVLPLLEEYQVPAIFFITGARDAGYDILWNDMLSIAYRYGPPRIQFINDEFKKAADGTYVSLSTGTPLAKLLRNTGFDEKARLLEQFKGLEKKIHPDYWQQMNTEQIKAISSSNWVTIGSHGYYHNDLATLPAGAVNNELSKSKGFLEDITGKSITTISFPYGSYNPVVKEAAKQAGYSYLCATEFLYEEDRFDPGMTSRLTINPFISGINQLYANIAGTY